VSEALISVVRLPSALSALVEVLNFEQMPNPAEMSNLVQAAVDWTRNNPRVNPAGVHLLSAWNEFDEGHFFGPVLPQYGGSSRLESVGAVLNRLQHEIASFDEQLTQK